MRPFSICRAWLRRLTRHTDGQRQHNDGRYQNQKRSTDSSRHSFSLRFDLRGKSEVTIRHQRLPVQHFVSRIAQRVWPRMIEVRAIRGYRYKNDDQLCITDKSVPQLRKHISD
jgi:hypothetical protein